MDNTTKASVANLIRHGVKVLDEVGWNHKGTLGPNGEMCAVMCVVEAARRNGFDLHGSLVEKAVDVLDAEAKKQDKKDLSGDKSLSYIAQFNEAEHRTKKEVTNLMGHAANVLTKWSI